MSPATDRVLAEGLTRSKTIIRVHLVHTSFLRGSRNPINKQGRAKTTRFRHDQRRRA